MKNIYSIFSVICLLFVTQILFAQEPTPKPSATPPASAVTTAQTQAQAEMKMITDAGRIKDPQKKLEAYEKAATTVNNPAYKYMAQISVVETLAKSFPTQTDRIRSEIEKLIENRDGSSSTYLVLARKLLDAGIMLDFAEELSKKALAKFEEEALAEANQQRVKYMSALGLIYQKTGRTKEAEKLLNQVVIDDTKPAAANTGLSKLIDESVSEWSKGSRRAAVSTSLADIAEKKGDYKKALNFLAEAAMFAPIKAAERKRLEDLYRKANKNSLDGLEELLDEKYHKLNSLAFKIEPYKATEKRGNRVVLAEFFTGSGCGPCVAADLAFEAMLKRYNRQELVVLVYHEHIPMPDPMTNPATIARGKFYAINSTPTHIIDGSRKTGGGERERAKAFYMENFPKVEDRLIIPAEAEVTLVASVEGGQIKAKVNVDKLKGESSDLRLQIALVENELSYTGENGVRIHPMAVRYLGGKDFGGFALTAGKPQTIEETFDISKVGSELQKYFDDFVKNPPEKYQGEEINFSKPMYKLNQNNLSVVAFVQDQKTKQILQASYVGLGQKKEVK